MILKPQWHNSFLIILIVSVCTVRAHVLLETVIAQLNECHQLHPQQVVTSFWGLSCHDTNAYIQELVNRYEYPEYDHQANVCMIHHCRVVHRFIKHVYVDEQWNNLIYKDRSPAPPFPSIITYWRTHQQYAYLDWYRFYADALSVVILRELHHAYISRGTSEYKDHSARAHMYFNEFKDIYTLFSGTVHEITYTQAVHRYQELLSLMRGEQ